MVEKKYKYTSIGKLPSEWKCEELREHLQLLTDYDANGSFADMANNVNTQWGFGYAWYVRATDLEQNSSLNMVRYADENTYDFLSKSSLNGGEVLLAKRGEIGKVYFFQMKTKYATLGPNLYLLKLKNTIIPKFIYEYFCSEIGQEKLRSINASTSLGAIYKEDVKSLLIPVPSIDEQKAIVEALSSIDNLILSLGKLIEKKKSIKQGAMQELLTGKKRINGFEGDWINVNLSEYSKIKARIGWQGLTTEEYLDQGYAYLVTGTDFLDGRIDWDNCHFVNEERFAQDKNIQIMNGDILITKDGTIGKVAYVMNLNSIATLNSGVFVIRAKHPQDYDSAFVYYILKSSVFTDFLNKLSAGSTINHLYQKDFVNFTFDIPQDIEEQKAIAEILFDMDSEITTLESKLLKYRQIKQGMMQELLTGKIRLM